MEFLFVTDVELIRRLITTVDTFREQLHSIASDLENNHLDRKVEIEGLMLAALSCEHILFLGPPGSDKTRLAVDFASYFDKSKFFYWLMGQFTNPDEIFGPISMDALKNDIYKRVPTNKLPEAHFAMLDEVYKASTAINNTLLHIMQERKFDNGGIEAKVPLNFIIAGSNELPADVDKLRALHDRFSLRYYVQYINDDVVFGNLLDMFVSNRNTKGTSQDIVHKVPHVSLEDLVVAQIDCAKLQLSSGAKKSIIMLWHVCKEQKLAISERRWGKLINIMQAQAWYKGQTQVESTNLIVAQNMLWDTTEQIATINKLVVTCIDPDIAKAEEIELAALDIQDEFRGRKNSLSSADAAQLIQTLKELLEHLEQLKSNDNITIIKTRISTIRGEIADFLRG